MARLYHGTHEGHLDNIRDQGLVGDGDDVWLTRKKREAMNYAEQAAKSSGKGLDRHQPVVLEVHKSIATSPSDFPGELPHIRKATHVPADKITHVHYSNGGKFAFSTK